MTLVIPAIDIKDGRCVRLYQGSYETETVYFDDPVKMAKLWRVQNAKVLHVVDLDSARGDRGINDDALRGICACLDIPVQIGGGIRTLDDVEAALEMGAYRVVIGTSAVRDPGMVKQAIERFGDRKIVVALDVREGEVRVDGWTEGSGVSVLDLAAEMESLGCTRFIYTDITRDGTLAGPNVQAYRELGDRLSTARITASGGVSGYLDLLRIKELEPFGVDSVVVGKALYENCFPCQQIWCWNDMSNLDLERFSSAPLC
ncbi:MAG: 1-(5-phosphoribosyl)-5-[(5-phosphoribosylamino)methylideneamino]imidazole-4-carboxamide isomerase [Rhodothermales bacterium]|nr:1-(5-phosphoribosyl)-5-[(5-phosphoribosylamino)methylideneamino]imidazole-4-carboxamide isomerase [Rhodothermales bacterium]